jgi:hypothetical protein
MYLLSLYEKKLLELDENKNVVNEYEIPVGVNEVGLFDGKVLVKDIACIVEKDEDGNVVSYEKVFVDVREFLSAQYLQNIGGK